ncbi:hypothetical protein RM530_05630 [Algiphilus sp. W345]|uniref:Uncharacterized protein n=1 Tax=Banduia mediterranea TaxID=3075609 RepID=A0ABU2WH40_9GAMM|nr:hypothetical protein [Algiphilus sp. W345]MDT0496843.1 hypothetical protein [Algiphilus sp. W345]
MRNPKRESRYRAAWPLWLACAYVLGMVLLGDQADAGAGRLVNLVLLVGLAAMLMFVGGIVAAAFAGAAASGLRQLRGSPAEAAARSITRPQVPQAALRDPRRAGG